MRMLLMAVLLLGAAGCGDGGNHAAITDPSNLPPLSAADVEEIRKKDAAVADEERGSPPPAKGRRR